MKSTFNKALVLALLISIVGSPLMAAARSAKDLAKIQAMARQVQGSMATDTTDAVMAVRKQEYEQAFGKNLMGRTKDAVVNSSVVTGAGRLVSGMFTSDKLTGQVNTLKQLIDSGTYVDLDKLSRTQRLALHAEYRPLSYFEKAQMYAGVAAHKLAKVAAAAYATTTGKVALAAAAAYGAYRLYNWATAKPAVKPVVKPAPKAVSKAKKSVSVKPASRKAVSKAQAAKQVASVKATRKPAQKPARRVVRVAPKAKVAKKVAKRA